MRRQVWRQAGLASLPIPREIGHVLVVSFPTAMPASATGSMLECLDPSERERWNRFQAPRVKGEFLVGKAMARRILGSALGLRAGDVRFTHNAKGKPELADGAYAFNLSHSHGWALFALTPSGRIGVDIERVRPVTDLMDLARRYFTPAEVEAIGIADSAAQLELFYRVWTRKEAFIKAHGLGVAYGLDRVEVSMDQEVKPHFARLGEGENPLTWSLEHLEPAPGYVGALACDVGLADLMLVHCVGWMD